MNRAAAPQDGLKGRAGWRVAQWGVLCLLWLAVVLGQASAQTENLLDRISNNRMRDFEGQLTANINNALGRYVSLKQYVLSVRVIWNRDLIPAVRTPGLAPLKQKLPGFPIFVSAPGAPVGDDSTPPFVRLVVKVLIDETLPEYYERFIRKIVPIVARFDSTRGDQVVVLKETFPVRGKDEELPPTLPEQELMKQLGIPVGPGATPKAPGAAPRPGIGLMEKARIAYDEGRYNDSLGIVQSAFQRATSNQERAMYLGMEGSIFYTMNNQDASIASWRRAVTFDPANMEVQRVLRFFETRPAQIPEAAVPQAPAEAPAPQGGAQ